MNNINLKESEIIEFKKSIGEINEIGKTIVSFANTFGGEIYVNVKDDGELQKNIVTDNTLKKITDLNPSFDPKMTALFNFETVDIQGFDIIKITVIKSEYNIHTFQGVCYLRQGTTDQKMTTEEIGKRYNQIKKKDWSTEVESSLTINSVDAEAYDYLYTNFYNLEKNKNKEKLQDKLSFLSGLGLVTDGYLNNTGIVFLCKIEYLPITIREKRKITYRYEDEKNNISERLNVEDSGAPFILLYKKILSEIEKRNYSLAEVSLFRNEVKQYDIKAIEEFLINAIVHRDWSEDLWIEVLHTPQYIRISNPGIFRSNLEEVIRSNSRSSYLNVNMSEFLIKINMMEKEGGGIKKSMKLQIVKGINDGVKYSFPKNRVNLIVDGFVKNIDFAKLIYSLRDLTELKIILLDKIYSGKNILGKDILDSDLHEIKDFVDKKGRGGKVLKIKNSLLSQNREYLSSFASTYTSKDTAVKTIMDYAKTVNSFKNSNIYSILQRPQSTIRKMLMNMADDGLLIRMSKGIYCVPKAQNKEIKEQLKHNNSA